MQFELTFFSLDVLVNLVVEATVEIKIIHHVHKHLPQLLDLLHYLLSNLVLEVELILSVFVQIVVCFGQELEILLINVDILALLGLLKEVNTILSKRCIMLSKHWLENT